MTELDPKVVKSLSEAAIAELEAELVQLIKGNNNASSNATNNIDTAAIEADSVSTTSHTSQSAGKDDSSEPSATLTMTTAYSQSAAGVAGLLNAQSENEYASELLYILRTAKPVV